MSGLNELIVEDAALECFGEQCRGAPTLIPAFSQGERRKSEGIRRLSSAIFFRTLAALCEGLLRKLLSGGVEHGGGELLMGRESMVGCKRA